MYPGSETQPCAADGQYDDAGCGSIRSRPKGVTDPVEKAHASSGMHNLQNRMKVIMKVDLECILKLRIYIDNDVETCPSGCCIIGAQIRRIKILLDLVDTCSALLKMARESFCSKLRLRAWPAGGCD